ncbi:MAG: hypothetical protein ACLTXM_16185 [Enterococcus sp.]
MAIYKKSVAISEGKEWIQGLELMYPRKAAAYDYEVICWHETSEPDPESNQVTMTIRIIGPDLKKVEGMVEVFEKDLGAVPVIEEG